MQDKNQNSTIKQRPRAQILNLPGRTGSMTSSSITPELLIPVWGLRNCTSNEFLGDANADGTGPG